MAVILVPFKHGLGTYRPSIRLWIPSERRVKSARAIYADPTTAVRSMQQVHLDFRPATAHLSIPPPPTPPGEIVCVQAILRNPPIEKSLSSI